MIIKIKLTQKIIMIIKTIKASEIINCNRLCSHHNFFLIRLENTRNSPERDDNSSDLFSKSSIFEPLSNNLSIFSCIMFETSETWFFNSWIFFWDLGSLLLKKLIYFNLKIKEIKKWNIKTQTLKMVVAQFQSKWIAKNNYFN